MRHRPYPRNLPQNVRQAICTQYNRKEWLELCALYKNTCVSCGQPETAVGKMVPDFICAPDIPTTSTCWLRIQPVCKRCSRFSQHNDMRPGGWERVLSAFGVRANNKITSHILKAQETTDTPPLIFE